MSGPKNSDNTQWGLVSLDGNRPGPLLNAGDGGEPLIDEHGRVWSREIAPAGLPTYYANGGAFANAGEKQVAVGARRLWKVRVSVAYNTGVVFFQIFDTAAAIAADIPRLIVPCGSGTSGAPRTEGVLDLSDVGGVAFATGIRGGLSIVASAYTTAGLPSPAEYFWEAWHT